MGRVYTASVTDVAVTVAQDFFELTAPSDLVFCILSCHIGQSSDAGDAAAEMLTINITRYSTSGSGGSTPTARPHHVGDAATSVIEEANNTTQGGTPVVLFSEAFNVQAGWHYVPIPEERIWVSPSGIIAIELPVAPGDSLTMSGSITYEVFGG